MPEPTRHTSPAPGDIADLVHELTASHVHREHYEIRRSGTWYGGDHQVRAPSLLLQLSDAHPSGQGQERASTGYGSRPAARLEAVDCLAMIDKEAAQWVRWLGEDDAGDTRAMILRLHGLLPGVDDATRRLVVRDIRRWWTRARVMSGWDSAAWRPNSTCPPCGERGGLRIKLVEQLAFCVECGQSWTAETIGVLADHIRAENADQGSPAAAPAGVAWADEHRPAQEEPGQAPTSATTLTGASPGSAA